MTALVDVLWVSLVLVVAGLVVLAMATSLTGRERRARRSRVRPVPGARDPRLRQAARPSAPRPVPAYVVHEGSAQQFEAS